MRKRTVCRRTKSGKFAKKAACKGYRKTKITVRRSKARQWLLF